MNGTGAFFSGQYSADELQRMHMLGDGSGLLGPGAMEGIDASGSIMTGQSLDDIVNQNNQSAKEMRRRSYPAPYAPDMGRVDPSTRRISMMEFTGASPAAPLNAFRFDPAMPPGMDGMMPQPEGMQPHSTSGDSGLAINTQFSGPNSAYGPMMTPGSAYASPMHPSVSLDMDLNSPFVTSNLGGPMDLTDPSLGNVLAPDASSMDMFGAPDQFASPIIQSPTRQGFMGSTQGPQPQDPGGGRASTASMGSHSATPEIRRNDSGSQERIVHSSSQTPSGRTPSAGSNRQSVSNASGPYGPEPPPLRQQPFTLGPNGQKFPWTTPPGGFPSTMANRPHMESQFKNAYSSTGFDMLGVLMRVATRPNPEIEIGSVDLSCAFVVCDAEQDDFPIVYCSENFERLTGYTKHMILGRNCRFLQSPDGMVEAGIHRNNTDDQAVFYLKNMIRARKEAQISLINYRRGGQPFMNLLTMIPITWDNPEQTKFFVGFQVDLVEQPSSVTHKNPDGSYAINYQRGLSMPRYMLNAPESSTAIDLGQTVPRDDVSAVLTTFGNAESEISKRLWDKVLLENTDDVIHVLSLKGLFLYLSPASRRILEYDASELVGSALSSVCHPSDIVPVTRELKDTSSSASVNVVYRIRRKKSGYMWFESHGSLHTEQGKGRKCIILVGRERPVYTLKNKDLSFQGGVGESELWTKLSTSGMFIFVSSNVRQLLDKTPEELVGTNIQSLMTQSKSEFSRILEMARNGKKASLKHEVMNRRGQVISAFTTIYPGDAVEGQKPTFIVAQTKLMKPSSSSRRPQIMPKHRGDSGESIPTSVNSGSTGPPLAPSSSTTRTGISASHFTSTDGAAATFAGQNGLAIGHQDQSLASDENVFDELKTTRSSSWQFELRQMEKQNRLLAEEVQSLLAARKKRKRRKGAGQLQKDCANCHTRVTPEWRRGPSGNRDLCNSCGLRWAKQNGRVSPRTPSQHSAQTDIASKASASPHQGTAGAPTVDPTGAQKMAPTTGAQVVSGKTSPQRANVDSHAAKVARMEIGGSSGFAGGVPERIDEGTEPE